MNLFTLISILLFIYILYILFIERKTETFINYSFTQPNNNFNSIFDNVNDSLQQKLVNYDIPKLPIRIYFNMNNNIELEYKKKIIKAIHHILHYIKKTHHIFLKFLSIEIVKTTIYSTNIKKIQVVFQISMPERFVSRSIQYEFYIYSDSIIPSKIITLQDNFIQKPKKNIPKMLYKTIYSGAYFNPSYFETHQPHEKIPLKFYAPNETINGYISDELY